jgi:hypothetical protein
MIMTTTKRMLVLLMALALPLAAVVMAGAVPPKCADDPTLPGCPVTTTTDPSTTTAPISGDVEVSITQHLAFESVANDVTPWVHEEGDLIIYSISGINDSGGPIDLADDLTGFLETDVTESPFGPYVRDYFVALSDIEWKTPDLGYVTNTVTVSGPGGVLADASAIAEFTPYEGCDFSKTITDVCIWKPSQPGEWQLTVDPTPLGRRVIRYQVTLRDHIPGNWCPTGLSGTWKLGDDPVSTIFTIPDWTQIPPGDPVCPLGGRAGDFFNVGTPDSFYLVASGDVTVTYLGP